MITTGAISISQALMVNQTLLELNMSVNDIKDEGITAIAGSLSSSSITVLDVMECGITFSGVRSLAAALSTNQNIWRLWLDDNPITVDGARLIMKSAVDNGVCEDVNIDDEYKDDDQVNEMMTILYDRRRRDVRNYVVQCNYYCYGCREAINILVKIMIVATCSEEKSLEVYYNYTSVTVNVLLLW